MRNRNLIIGLVLVGLCMAMSLVLVAWAIFQSQSFGGLQARVDLEVGASKLDRRLEDAKKVGVPLTKSELGFYGNTPADIDLGEKLVSLGSRLATEDNKRTLTSRIQAAVNSGNIQAARKLLSPLDQDFDSLSTSLQKARIPIDDLDLGHLTPNREALHSLNVARALGARSRLRALTGDLVGGLRDVETLHKLAERLLEMHQLLPDLRADSALTQCFNSVSHLIYGFREDESALSKIGTVLAQLRPEPEDLSYLDSEIYLGIASIRNSDLYANYDSYEELLEKEPDALKRLLREGKPKRLWGRGNLAEFLGMAIEIRKKASTIDDPDAKAEAVDKITHRWSFKPEANYKFIGDFWALDAGRKVEFRKLNLARYDCTSALLKILGYQHKEGKLPKNLADAGFTATDPFNNEPYRYNIEVEGFRIYSVGADGKANGGISSRELRRKGVTEPKEFDEPVGFPPIP